MEWRHAPISPTRPLPPVREVDEPKPLPLLLFWPIYDVLVLFIALVSFARVNRRAQSWKDCDAWQNHG